MPWTKQHYIDAAFEEIGLAGYVFELSPEQEDRAVRTLDAMMASWNAMGIRVGYPISSSPDSTDIAAVTGVPDSANEAIYTNLAIRLAPRHGKTASAELKAAAGMSYRAILNRSVNPLPVQMPATMPAGQGHRRYQQGRVFLNPPTDPIATGPDGQIDELEVE